jgi:hypothetical protein
MKVAPVNAPHNSPHVEADRSTHRTGHLAQCQRRNHQVQVAYSTILVMGSSRMSVAPMLFNLGMSRLTMFLSTTVSTA